MEIEVNKVSTDWKKMPMGVTYLLIGQPKTGKTTAASEWSEKGSNGVLIIDTDLGADFTDEANTVTVTTLNPPTRPVLLKGKQVMENGFPQVEVIPPDERGFKHRNGKKAGKIAKVYSLIEIYQWLEKEWDNIPYDTIVLDTIGQVNEWIETTVVQELGITAMGEGQWGADWGKARKKNVDIVKRFQTLAKKNGGNFVIISHSKTTTITDGKVQLGPDLPRGLGYSLAAKADVIGYCTANKEDGTFQISFEAYDERVVGSRLRPLAQKILPFNYEAIRNEILTYKKKDK